eukprot:1134534-Rhodomonas_salina.2
MRSSSVRDLHTHPPATSAWRQDRRHCNAQSQLERHTTNSNREPPNEPSTEPSEGVNDENERQARMASVMSKVELIHTERSLPCRFGGQRCASCTFSSRSRETRPGPSLSGPSESPSVVGFSSNFQPTAAPD